CLMNIFYSEFKNVIARLAPVKELLREREWHVTPRTVPQPDPVTPDSATAPPAGFAAGGVVPYPEARS
ncbi:hypothetical protein, partial [Frankia sp. CcWB3]